MKAASARYYNVWPNVKEQARMILAQCRAQIRAGRPWVDEVLTGSELEEQWFPYEVPMTR